MLAAADRYDFYRMQHIDSRINGFLNFLISRGFRFDFISFLFLFYLFSEKNICVTGPSVESYSRMTDRYDRTVVSRIAGS